MKPVYKEMEFWRYKGLEVLLFGDLEYRTPNTEQGFEILKVEKRGQRRSLIGWE